MVQLQLKLKQTKLQEQVCAEWLWILTGVYNWALRKIEQEAKNKIYCSNFDLHKLVSCCSKRLNIPSHTIQAIITQAAIAWQRCFKKLAKKPKFKGKRNKLNSIPFPDVIKNITSTRIKLPLIGSLKFHKQQIPTGKIKCARIVKRASGWYLCLFIDTTRSIKSKGCVPVGIDPGFKHLLTLSNGVKINNPQEFNKAQTRLAQAQRGNNKRLAARIHEHISNQKKDRNHKLSLNLVQNFNAIYFSKDNIKGIQKKFGKSVANSNHYQLRQMLDYKSRAGGIKYVEVPSKNSTRTCSTCGSLSGPTGLSGLSVRHWTCTTCGSYHDRDVNAAMNTLNVGAGLAHEISSNTKSEIVERLQ